MALIVCAYLICNDYSALLNAIFSLVDSGVDDIGSLGSLTPVSHASSFFLECATINVSTACTNIDSSRYPTHVSTSPLIRADDLVSPIVLTGPPLPHEKFTKQDDLIYCHSCSYISKRIDHMRRHILHRHSLFKPYSCAFCNREFSRDIPLKDHIRTVHTGETPYKCRHCPQAFPSSYNLWQHCKLQHNGKK